MSSIKKLTQKRLFLPIFSMILVMLINVVYDIATGSAPLGFFMISIKNGVLYGRLIDILNRGSEIAILAIGMTLVVSASGGTDISVGSVMSLYAGVCCMILAGYGNVNVQEYAQPLLVGIGAGSRYNKCHTDCQDGDLTSTVQDVDETSVKYTILNGNHKEGKRCTSCCNIIYYVDQHDQDHTENRKEQTFLRQFFEITHYCSPPAIAFITFI